MKAKWWLTKLNENLLKSRIIMKMKDKKTNGRNQMRIKMKMIIKIKMKMKHKMKVMENKNQKTMKIRIQMKEQMIQSLLITKKLNRNKMLSKLKHPRMMSKKSLKMKYLSYKDKTIIETINFNNKIIKKTSIWEINITLFLKDSSCKLLHNLIK